MQEIPTSIKKKELVERKRAQIIRAANKLFCESGFHKTTLKDISEGAGMSQGSIYDYIRNKEDILYLIHAHLFNLLTTGLHRSLRGIEYPLEKLKEIIHTELKIMYEFSDSILLMYQEAHSLGKVHRKNLLEKEKNHELIYEGIINDCINQGLISKINTRIAANTLINMMHTYVIRRWDIAKHVTIKEMGQFIIKIFLHGLLLPKGQRLEQKREIEPLKGKTVLIINGSNKFGIDLYSFLLSKGARLAIHGDSTNKIELSSFSGRSENIRFYSTKDYGEINSHLFDQILNDIGQISIVIQDLSVDVIKATSPSNTIHKSQRLEQDFKCAEDIPVLLEKNMNKSGHGRLLYIAPWAWDKYTCPLNYDVIKAGAIALTRAMAMKLAPSKINVNCVVPGFISGVKGAEMEREKISEILKLVPLNCTGTIGDVLDAIYYFISDSSKYVTGQILDVTGGMI